MRTQRQDIKLLQEGEASEDNILNAKVKYRITSDEYVRFSEAMNLPQQRERVTVDGLRNIGNIEKRQVRMAKSAVRNTGKQLKFDPDADYSIKIDGYKENVQKGLSTASLEVAKEGSKDGNEHLALVNLNTGEIEYRETGDATSVGWEGFYDFISSENNTGNKYAFVHNHNTDGYFSETDMRTLVTVENIRAFVAVRLDGVIYFTEKTKNSHPYAIFDDLFKEEIKELNLKYRNGIIGAGERTRLREEIIVDGLIRDYTKGLIEIDGRLGNSNT